MTRYMITAAGPDKPGIVAAVTAALAAKDCNLEDTSMTRLGGHFVMLLLVASDADLTAEELSDVLHEQSTALGLRLSVEAIADGDADRVATGERWAISVYGADRRGIVAAITAKLAETGVNIEDLSTRVTGEASAPVYTMLIDATVPAGIEGGEVATELDRLGTDMGVTCHARPVDADTF